MTFTWTCGECGDSYSCDGPLGELVVERQARTHKAKHLTDELMSRGILTRYPPAMPNDRERAMSDKHSIEIESTFTIDGYRAICSCGWQTNTVATSAEAVREGDIHREAVRAEA